MYLGNDEKSLSSEISHDLIAQKFVKLCCKVLLSPIVDGNGRNFAGYVVLLKGVPELLPSERTKSNEKNTPKYRKNTTRTDYTVEK